RVRRERSRAVRPPRGVGRRVRGEAVSARIESAITRGEAWETWAATLVVVVGFAVLVARPFAETATGTRTALFAASYLTIGLSSIAVPLKRERPHLAPGLALLWGFGAVAVAANASRSAVPPPRPGRRWPRRRFSAGSRLPGSNRSGPPSPS